MIVAVFCVIFITVSHIHITETDKHGRIYNIVSYPKTVITGEENAALSYLPDRLSHEVKKQAALYGGIINEIRLRSEGLLSITVMGRNITCRITVSEKECSDTLMRLCRNSVYSYSNSIKEGYVTTPEGIRAGICGKAICQDNIISSVYGVNSICIRIPRRIPGTGDTAYELLREMSFQKGLIVWSIPGIGKTTLLRELISRLGSGDCSLRVSVVDTRHELGVGIKSSGLIDILDGYPRAKGIEIAKRTMSPQIIVCDEISTAEDAIAILSAAEAGIPIVASTHAGSRDELFNNKCMREILASKCIGIYLGLLAQTPGGYKYDIYKKDLRF